MSWLAWLNLCLDATVTTQAQGDAFDCRFADASDEDDSEQLHKDGLL